MQLSRNVVVKVMLVFALSAGGSIFEATGTWAQEEPDGCPQAEPARAINFAQSQQDVIIAVVSPVDSYQFELGVTLNVIKVVEGEFALGETKADAANPFPSCVKDLWVPRKPMLGVFTALKDPINVSTLEAWPLRAADGSPLTADQFSSENSLPADARVDVTDGESLTIAELLDAGRAFVAPTPTPFPPGVFPSTVVAADGGGIAPPNTGGLAAQDNYDESGWLPGAVILFSAVAVAVVMLASAVRMKRR